MLSVKSNTIISSLLKDSIFAQDFTDFLTVIATLPQLLPNPWSGRFGYLCCIMCFVGYGQERLVSHTSSS